MDSLICQLCNRTCCDRSLRAEDDAGFKEHAAMLSDVNEADKTKDISKGGDGRNEDTQRSTSPARKQQLVFSNKKGTAAYEKPGQDFRKCSCIFPLTALPGDQPQRCVEGSPRTTAYHDFRRSIIFKSFSFFLLSSIVRAFSSCTHCLADSSILMSARLKQSVYFCSRDIMGSIFRHPLQSLRSGR